MIYWDRTTLLEEVPSFFCEIPDNMYITGVDLSEGTPHAILKIYSDTPYGQVQDQCDRLDTKVTETNDKLDEHSGSISTNTHNINNLSDVVDQIIIDILEG